MGIAFKITKNIHDTKSNTFIKKNTAYKISKPYKKNTNMKKMVKKCTSSVPEIGCKST